MKRCLADVNVWLALLVGHHEHHAKARTWFRGLRAGETAMPRAVQLAVVRLLSNAAVMKQHVLSTSAAWTLVTGLTEDERVDFLPEPAGIETTLGELLRHPGPTPKLLNDAYIAAMAMNGALRMVTLDRGFTAFRGLDLELL